MPDRYPDDLFETIRQLTARVDALEAQLRQRPGVTQASQGWLLSDMSIPSVAAGQCQIGCSGGEFFAATASGTRRMFLQAAAIANQGSLLSGQIAGAPTQAQYNNLQTDMVATRAYGFALTTILRDAGIIDV